ncbi:hypothetical protein BDL97_17G034800 [Sphagnum fallax]|nr:hypothetical protein BDL97_17G034800 [Sphagnum fallax]KAH9535030.1 hypothetical protein CY35_17G032900 [Sphagnum magellanicum]KAH9535031.1 hypothetical protein CY35_17G032900 [Sphagnum magellanicum]
MEYQLDMKLEYPLSDYQVNGYGDESKKRKLSKEESNGSILKLSKDELKKLLEPLTKEQLVALLVDAGFQFASVADDIRDLASKDPAHRKLFVRGLAWETSSQALRDAFEQFGEIEEGAVITDKGTGKSRGFGFITFKHMDSAQRALREPSKNIDGRITVCNLASSGSSSGTSVIDQSQRKLYIGGLSYDTSSDTLLNIFSQYGEIEEGAVAYDKNTNKSRGFAFVTFKTIEGAKRAMEDSNKSIEGRHVIVKLAAEGQRERAPAQVAALQVQSVPQVQSGYSAVNPNISNYARPQVAAPTAPTLAFSAYAPLTYMTQPTYAGLTTSQFGPMATATPQYNPSQYSQYAAAFATPQSTQTGLPTGATVMTGSLPSYYTG